jgi:hypothetical protein
MKKSRFAALASSFALAAGLLISFSPIPAMAHGMHHRMMKRMIMHGGPIPFYLMNQDRLKLSPDQVKSLINLKTSFEKKAIMERASIHVLKIDIMSLMRERKIDTAKADRDLDRIAEKKKSLMKAFVDVVAQAHTILTPKQFAESKKLWRQMILVHHEMGGHGPMHH